MKIAFMFPGQGAQSIGMGKDLYDQYEEYREVIQKASNIAGIDIAALCFDSNIETLSKTENTQLAIASMSLGILAILKDKHITSQLDVGLSLGEYPALIDGGYLNFEDGIRLLKKRGYLMGNYVPKEKYAMIAVIGLASQSIEKICQQKQQENLFVVPANYNYSGQTVISGTEEAIEGICPTLKELGARKVVKLKTGGPFHTTKLEQAKKEYKKELQKVQFMKGSKSVIKNLDGQYYKPEDNIADILAKHIVSPVRFDKAIQKMKEAQIDTFVEIGPGKALTGFVKKELKAVKTLNILDVPSLKIAMEQLI